MAESCPVTPVVRGHGLKFFCPKMRLGRAIFCRLRPLPQPSFSVPLASLSTGLGKTCFTCNCNCKIVINSLLLTALLIIFTIYVIFISNFLLLSSL
jgi:hypothetical protein